MTSLLERLLSGTPLSWDLALVTDSLDDAGVETVTAARVLDPARVLVAVDHDTPAGTVAVAERQRKLLEFARGQGLPFRYGQGIGYHLALEGGLVPGSVAVCCGRHAAVLGAGGVLGLSLPPRELKTALETGTVSPPAAEVCRLRLTGTLDRYVTAWDLALHLAPRCRGRIAVLSGGGLDSCQRAAVCGLLAASGAVTAFFTGEPMDGAETVELAEVSPMAVLPGNFDRIVHASRVDGLRVNQVFIGGCAGGTLEALRRTAAIWRCRRVDPYVRVLVTPATAKVYARALEEGLVEVFMDAGALVMNQGCSACWAQSQGRCDGGEVFVTTGFVNCPGWAGRDHDGIYIAPVERAAWAALTGSLYES